MTNPLVRTGLQWWKWSAIYALIIGAVEVLVLFGFAMAGEVEFAFMGTYFVTGASALSVPATGVLIAVWLAMVHIAPFLHSARWSLIVYVFAWSWPLFLNPLSFYEFALAAPTVLGFLLPRFAYPRIQSTRSGEH